MFTAAVAAAKAMPRWSMTHADDEDLTLEGVATTLIMRFKVSASQCMVGRWPRRGLRTVLQFGRAMEAIACFGAFR